MKKQKQKRKQNKNTKKSPSSKRKQIANLDTKGTQEKQIKQKPVKIIPKKVTEKKKVEAHGLASYVGIAGRFLKESRMELKKVKWPTRKELLASTAVVIVLTLLVALFLGLVDFGLIKILKNIVR